MSKIEKIIRSIITFISMMVITVCFCFILEYLNIDNPALETFLHIGFSVSLGFITGNIINNTLSLPNNGDE